MGPAHPLRFVGGLHSLNHCEERLFEPVPPPPPDGCGSKFGAFVPPLGVGGIGVVDAGLLLFVVDIAGLLVLVTTVLPRRLPLPVRATEIS